MFCIFEDMNIPGHKKIYYKFLIYLRFITKDLNNLLKVNINIKRKFVRIILFHHEIINTEWKS